MADKGFLIGDILPRGVSLNILSFLDPSQFTPQQIIQTESIAYLEYILRGQFSVLNDTQY